jgi:nucleoside-diphosphate-sugar epimerase
VVVELNGKRVLVTGGAGFIGSHLVDRLLARNAKVTVLDNLSTGRISNLGENLERVHFIRGDIRELAACRRACQGADWVFHQAALGSVPRSMADPSTTIAVNVAGTANVLAAARDALVKRVVYASSSSVYGDAEALPKREGEEGSALSPYALSKASCEALAAAFARCFGMELIGLRYFNVYGPRQDPGGPYAAVVPRFFTAALSGTPPVIYGDGEQSRDFTFVSDAVAANLGAIAAPREACGRAYNVSGGRRVTLNELAALVRELAGGPPPRHERARAGDIRHSEADLSLACRALSFAPATSLAEGLAASRDHYAASLAPAAAEASEEPEPLVRAVG